VLPFKRVLPRARFSFRGELRYTDSASARLMPVDLVPSVGFEPTLDGF
jgi:hypothetical protein